MSSSRQPPQRPPPQRPPAADPLTFPPFTPARKVRAQLIAGILRSGRPVPDDAFDEIYPNAVVKASPVHWTPVHICARAVALLALPPGARLLDAGAGVGKFCVVAAAMMSRVRVRGIEQHPALAGIARETARRLGVEVEISEGEFADEDPRRVDAVYFFNPFTIPLLLPGLRAEFSADLGARQGAAGVAAAEKFLAAARPGLRVATYCGFGGSMPAGYTQLAREVWSGSVLELWEKGSDTAR